MLELLSHALRWSKNTVTELAGNYAKFLSPDLNRDIANLLQSFQTAIDSVGKEQFALENQGRVYEMWNHADDQHVYDMTIDHPAIANASFAHKRHITMLKVNMGCVLEFEGRLWSIQRVK